MPSGSKTKRDKVIHEIELLGSRNDNTIELPGYYAMFDVSKNTSQFWEDEIGADTKLVSSLMKLIATGKEVVLGAYDSHYYLFLKDEIKKASNTLINEGYTTRRSIVHFPEGHCFNTIQVMPRNEVDKFGNSKAKVYVSVSMRSCNAEVNFADDMMLAYLVSKSVMDNAGSLGLEFLDAKYSIKAFFGSIHIFK